MGALVATRHPGIKAGIGDGDTKKGPAHFSGKTEGRMIFFE